MVVEEARKCTVRETILELPLCRYFFSTKDKPGHESLRRIIFSFSEGFRDVKKGTLISFIEELHWFKIEYAFNLTYGKVRLNELYKVLFIYVETHSRRFFRLQFQWSFLEILVDTKTVTTKALTMGWGRFSGNFLWKHHINSN